VLGSRLTLTVTGQRALCAPVVFPLPFTMYSGLPTRSGLGNLPTYWVSRSFYPPYGLIVNRKRADHDQGDGMTFSEDWNEGLR
jgi:hypothetical protein